MILYCCGHLIALSYIFVNKYHHHRNQDAVLLVREFNKNKPFCSSHFAKELVRKGLFTKILPLPESVWLTMKNDDDVAYEERLRQTYSKYLSEAEIPLSDIEKIYVNFDLENEPGIFLSSIGMESTYIETCVGHYDIIRLEEAVPRNWGGGTNFSKLHRKYDALTGANNKWVVNRIRYSDPAKPRPVSLAKDSWWDPMEHFYTLPARYRQIITSCFEPSQSPKVGSEIILLLTNSRGYVVEHAKLPNQNYCLPYMLLLDYYLPGKSKIYVKSHPYGSTPAEDQLHFHGNILLEQEVPLEFYGLLDGFRINTSLSVNTTATFKVQDFIDQSLELGDCFYTNHRLCHKLYFTFLIHQMTTNFKTRNHAAGIDRNYLVPFARLCCGLPGYDSLGIRWDVLGGDIFTIVDKVPPEARNQLVSALVNTGESSKIVFLNSTADFAFCGENNPELLDYVVPIKIEKSSLHESCLSDTQPEAIYFFCKDPAIRRKVEAFSISKELNRTKLKLTAQAWDFRDLGFDVDGAGNNPAIRKWRESRTVCSDRQAQKERNALLPRFWFGDETKDIAKGTMRNIAAIHRACSSPASFDEPLWRETEEFLVSSHTQAREDYGDALTIGDSWFIGRFLAVLQPHRIVEIGVNSGFSSSLILGVAEILGLLKKNTPFLYSLAAVEEAEHPTENMAIRPDLLPYWSKQNGTTVRHFFETGSQAWQKGNGPGLILVDTVAEPCSAEEMMSLSMRLPANTWILLRGYQEQLRQLMLSLMWRRRAPLIHSPVTSFVAQWHGEKVLGVDMCFNMAALQVSPR